jgi:ComF family protein
MVCGRCASRLRRASWPRCPRCHFPRATGRPDQSDCRECEQWPEALTFARYAYVLHGPVSDLVHSLKYEGWAELAPTMGDALARVSLPEIAAPTVVTPMPTTSARARTRGYNQAGLLAGQVAQLKRLPLVEALQRSSAARSQTSLHPSERHANVRGAFSVHPPEREAVQGAHVLLVDDVLTTGATASAAASELTAAGARAVTTLAFARALPAGLHSSR